MRVRRCYTPKELAVGVRIQLDDRARHHLINVLRACSGDALVLFNGDGSDYAAVLNEATQQHAIAEITGSDANHCEPLRRVTLIQAVAKGERMDWVMQKATELGVIAIQPIFTERAVVNLTGARLHKRVKHWQNIVISACEQCGRARVPDVAEPLQLGALNLNNNHTGVVLYPSSEHSLRQQVADAVDVSVVIGPEGGFSDQEMRLLLARGFIAAGMGHRILRTETAALAALAVLNHSEI